MLHIARKFKKTIFPRISFLAKILRIPFLIFYYYKYAEVSSISFINVSNTQGLFSHAKNLSSQKFVEAEELRSTLVPVTMQIITSVRNNLSLCIFASSLLHPFISIFIVCLCVSFSILWKCLAPHLLRFWNASVTMLLQKQFYQPNLSSRTEKHFISSCCSEICQENMKIVLDSRLQSTYFFDQIYFPEKRFQSIVWASTLQFCSDNFFCDTQLFCFANRTLFFIKEDLSQECIFGFFVKGVAK